MENIKDILHRLDDRFPRPVIIWPVTVQGSSCASEVSAAVDGFNSDGFKENDRPDLLIIARGGGSVEDLWGFNDETIVRSVAKSRIPVISAIGHETDLTLLDFVSDFRAPTPSAAAEIAVPVRSDLLAQIRAFDQRLVRSINNFSKIQRDKLKDLDASFPSPDLFLFNRTQFLDFLEGRFVQSLSLFLNRKKLLLAQTGSKILSCKVFSNDLTQKMRALEASGNRLTFLLNKTFMENKKQLLELVRLLDSLSYRNTLERGYSVVRNSHNEILTRQANIGTTKNLVLELFVGKVDVEVLDVVPDPENS